MMLCAHYSTSGDFVPVSVEPKIDGVRCWVIVRASGEARAVSRHGTDWTQLISRQVRALRAEVRRQRFDEDVVFDCELAGASWSETMSSIRRGDASGLVLHVFDLLQGNGCHETGSPHPYTERRADLADFFCHADETALHDALIGCVCSRECHSDADVQRTYGECLALGYEGAVVKRGDSTYRPWVRTRDWGKLKPWGDATGTVVRRAKTSALIVRLEQSDGGAVLTLSAGVSPEVLAEAEPGRRLDVRLPRDEHSSYVFWRWH